MLPNIKNDANPFLLLKPGARVVCHCPPKFQILLHKAKKEIQESGGIAHKDFWQDIEN